jgi:hypothetical protein
MKVLLDECCPRPLQKILSGADIFTVEMAKLKGLTNGELISAAEASFDVLITADKSLRYQQNLKRTRLAILELPFNSWIRLKSMLPQIQNALSKISAGEYLQIPPTT